MTSPLRKGVRHPSETAPLLPAPVTSVPGHAPHPLARGRDAPHIAGMSDTPAKDSPAKPKPAKKPSSARTPNSKASRQELKPLEGYLADLLNPAINRGKAVPGGAAGFSDKPQAGYEAKPSYATERPGGEERPKRKLSKKADAAFIGAEGAAAATATSLQTLLESGNPFIEPGKAWVPHRPPRPDKSEGGIRFRMNSEYEPAGDQPAAIAELVEGISRQERDQVLLGVTGSGKTFTMAQVIEKTQRPALILAPNKTLAAQLYGEFKSFFPDNAVEYFVSYYDYYQPEAYVPRSDTFIEKESSINEQIDRMRHSATRSLIERDDVIIVASVSCIYGIGSVETYTAMTFGIKLGERVEQRQLIADLVALRGVMPEKTRETARQVIAKVVAELLERLERRTAEAIRGALDRSRRTRRPRHADIDWPRTIHANLRHYQPEFRTIVPETLIGFLRQQRRIADLDEVVLCVDQSGSMASSVVYASIFAAVMASLPVVKTKLICFDTAIVDLTDDLADPVEVLFGIQLGGGTDIDGAMAYCEGRIEQPSKTHLVLISDMYEGGNADALVDRVARLVTMGVNVIVLLALTDSGRPSYDPQLSGRVAALGVPVFACTPDQFPDLMATALRREDVHAWAAGLDIKLVRSDA